MMSKPDGTAKKVCDAMVAEHARRAEYSESGKLHKHRLKDAVWVDRQDEDVLSRHRAAVMVHIGYHTAESGAKCVCDPSGEQQDAGGGSHSVAPATTRSPWPGRYL